MSRIHKLSCVWVPGCPHFRKEQLLSVVGRFVYLSQYLCFRYFPCFWGLNFGALFVSVHCLCLLVLL